MTREQIENNRETIIEELRSTELPQAEDIISRMESSGFFTAGCQRHDEAEGGAANHALWSLCFALEAIQENADISEEDMIVACLGHGFISCDKPVDDIVSKAQEQAIWYCDSIPFEAEASKSVKALSIDRYVDVKFSKEEHIMWLGADTFDSSETIYDFPVHQIMSVPVCASAEILVLTDDNGLYSMMFQVEDGIYRSDKVMFGYSDLEFYISRYPQYRSSYIAARNAKGRWGVLRVRENRKSAGERLIVEKVIDFTWRSGSKAVDHMMSHSGYPIRVQHSGFYTKIPIAGM